MEYRELGRTGIKVSVIALGCEGFVANEGALTEQLLNAAEQGGINCIDLYAPQPEMRSRLGKWLRGRAVNLFYRHIYVQFGRRDSISGPGSRGSESEL